MGKTAELFAGDRMIYMTGATGRIGRYVYRYLSKKINLVPLVRKPSGLKNEVVSDFSAESLRTILKNASAIIHLAGSVKTYDKKELWMGNVEVTRAVVDAAPKKAKIIFASSISVYGKDLLKKPADEATPLRPDSEYARSKYEAERIVSAHPNNVILRIGTVYGPFNDYMAIIRKIKDGKMFIIGNGENIIPFVHVEDVAKIFLPALKARGVYNIVGGPITQIKAYEIVANELGVQPPKTKIPFFVAHSIARISEMVALLAGKECRMTAEHAAILYFDRPFDCRKAGKELGFSPVDPAIGIRDVVRKLEKKL